MFRGETISDTIAAILEREPEWGALPAHTPAGVRQLLRRCLDKDPKRRLHDIADARIEIDDVQSGLQQDGRVAQVPAGSRRRLAWASTLAVITLIAAAIGVWALRPALTAPEARLEINTPPTNYASLAISPDGLKIVFAARSGGQAQLWLRSLDSSSARPLPGTERAASPFWSPDSRSIGFFADNKLKRMDIDGTSVKTLMSGAPAPLGGAWNSDGTIVFSTRGGNPILRISAEGGEPSAATRFESPQQRSHSSPQFLPDGRHFLFFVSGSPERVASMSGNSTDWTRNACSTRMHRPCLPRPGICFSSVKESCWRRASIRTGWKRGETRFQLPTRDRGNESVRIGRGAYHLAHDFRQRPAAARVGRSVW